MTTQPDNNEALVLDKALEQEKEPSLFTVVILNDDFTPINFVIEMLMNVFKIGSDDAEAITMQIHEHGKGNVGQFTKDVAESKSQMVNYIAQKNEFPLLSQVEEL